MNFSDAYHGREAELAELFTATFNASEGPDEGDLVGRLARDLLNDVPPRDLRVFLAQEDGALGGAILFTRMTYDRDARVVFLLSPVAVATALQGRGVGQSLLEHGLQQLRAEGVDVAVTYGSPAYYGRVGFRPTSVSFAAAPFDLQQPEGWLAQPLSDRPWTPLLGAPTVAPALQDPALW